MKETFVKFDKSLGGIVDSGNIKKVICNDIGEYTIIFEKPLGKKPTIWFRLKRWFNK